DLLGDELEPGQRELRHVALIALGRERAEDESAAIRASGVRIDGRPGTIASTTRAHSASLLVDVASTSSAGRRRASPQKGPLTCRDVFLEPSAPFSRLPGGPVLVRRGIPPWGCTRG